MSKLRIAYNDILLVYIKPLFALGNRNFLIALMSCKVYSAFDSEKLCSTFILKFI